MTPLGPNTQDEERPELRVARDFSRIPAPSDATWVGEWHLFECDCCGDVDWQRYFTGRSWTVETSFPEPMEVHLSGSQYSDGSTYEWICLDGKTHNLNPEDARMLAATLFRAADGLERIRGGRL
jgi:hypothetical protein